MVKPGSLDNRQGNGLAEPMTTPPLLIAWHGRTGASQSMARAAGDGAGERGQVVYCEDVTAEMVFAARGYLFCCPENLATMSGAMKEMFDRLYYPLLGRIEGRAYATIIAAGSDGTGAQAQIDRIATGWRLKRVVEPMIVNFGAQTPEAIMADKTVAEDTLRRCREMGEGFSEGLAQGVF